jgi:hypothetical protein
MWCLDEVGKCDLVRRMGVWSLHVDCNSAGFEKGGLAHVIRQCSIGGSQVLQKVVVLHHLIQLDGCRRQIVGRMQHRSDDCCRHEWFV